jgi:iron(III) transport system substrate-binding protein
MGVFFSSKNLLRMILKIILTSACQLIIINENHYHYCLADWRDREMRKSGSLILSMVVLVGIVLAGCGSKQTGGNDNQAPTANGVSKASGVVNIYTARNYEADKLLFKSFEQETGIKVNLVEGTAEELIERLKREGTNSGADLFLTVDGGVLNKAKKEGILQPLISKVVEQQVPASLRDKDQAWIGIATRARILVYANDRVKPEQLSTYEDLAADKWKGKLLIRSSTSLYNQSLLASIIELNGEEAASKWAKGVAANLARKPEGGDRDQVKAIAAGTGDVAIINTYYLGQMINSADAEEVKAAEKVRVFFPNQKTNGAHVNISGLGLTKASNNKENAIKLVEYLTSVPSQSLIASKNYEYPVNPKADKGKLLTSWGEFKAQAISFDKLGDNNKKAIELFAQAGWK